MKFPIPRLYLGTMTFGWSQTSSYVDESVALEMLRMFIDFNHNINNHDGTSSNGTRNTTPPVHHYIDTARIYAGGKTEEILGTILKTYHQEQEETGGDGILCIGTKAHPSQPFGLSPKGIRTQIQASLDAMQLSSTSDHITTTTTILDEFYLHQPDTDHSLLESLQEAHQLVVQGICQSIGMSNYHVSEMERAFQLCDEYQLTKPSVYQGLYNPLNRHVETKLIPLLKQHHCRFVAYNPLAAGLLTGKHTATKSNQNKNDDNDDNHNDSYVARMEVPDGRFKNNPNYLPRFYTNQNFQAMTIIQEACQKEGISMVDATYGWLLCHSILEKDDGILIGASSMSQLQENLQACQKAAAAATAMDNKNNNKGVLSESLLQAFEDAWNVMKDQDYDCGTGGGAFPYWRSYSSDMPNQKELDQGASYAATKK